MFIKLKLNKKVPAEKGLPKYDIDKIDLNLNSVAFYPPKGVIIIDTDSPEATERIKEICGENVFYQKTKTEGHAHFYFRFAEDIVGQHITRGSMVGFDYNLLRLLMDYRGFNKSHGMLHGSKKEIKEFGRELTKRVQEETLPVLPAILYPIKKGFELLEVIDKIEQGRRDDDIFKKVIPRVRQYWIDDEGFIVSLLCDIAKYKGWSDLDRSWAEYKVKSSFNMGGITNVGERVILNTDYANCFSYSDKTDAITGVVNYNRLWKLLHEDLGLYYDSSTEILWCKNFFGDTITMTKLQVEMRVGRHLNNKLNDGEDFTPSIMNKILNNFEYYVVEKNWELTTSNVEIAFKNGVYNLETDEFFDGKISHENQIMYDYKPEVDIGVKEFILNMFNEWSCIKGSNTPDKEFVQQLFEWIGLSMTKCVEFNSFLLLEGEGHNGKSQYLYIIQEILGEHNYSAEGLNALTQNPFSSYRMYGKLANIVTDAGFTKIQNTDIIKKTVSGEIQSIQNKNEQIKTVKMYAKILVSQNRVSEFNEASNSRGIDRRMIIMPFKNVFETASKFEYRKRKKVLLSEKYLEGIITLAVQAISKCFKEETYGLTEGRRSRDAKLIYKSETQSVYRFVSEKINKNGTLVVSSEQTKSLYNEYKVWCGDDNEKATSFRDFKNYVIAAVKDIEKRNIVLERLRGIEHFVYDSK